MQNDKANLHLESWLVKSGHNHQSTWHSIASGQGNNTIPIKANDSSTFCTLQPKPPQATIARSASSGFSLVFLQCFTTFGGRSASSLRRKLREKKLWYIKALRRLKSDKMRVNRGLERQDSGRRGRRWLVINVHQLNSRCRSQYKDGVVGVYTYLYHMMFNKRLVVPDAYLKLSNLMVVDWKCPCFSKFAS